MAEIKKRVLYLSTGKQIKLYGTCIGIGKSMEIGECYAPNILSPYGESANEISKEILNPHKLTKEEIMELADLNIRLWVDLKENIRKFGLDKKIFARE